MHAKLALLLCSHPFFLTCIYLWGGQVGKYTCVHTHTHTHTYIRAHMWRSEDNSGVISSAIWVQGLGSNTGHPPLGHLAGPTFYFDSVWLSCPDWLQTLSVARSGLESLASASPVAETGRDI